jgi:hypothetical protein
MNSNWNIAAITISIAGIAIIILRAIESRNRIKIELEKNLGKETFTDKLKKIEIEKNNPEESIKTIGIIAKDFLSEKYLLDANQSYLQLSEELFKKELFLESKFCKNITEAFYSGERVDNRLISELVKDLKEIINKKEKPITEEAKKESIIKRISEKLVEILENLGELLRKEKKKVSHELDLPEMNKIKHHEIKKIKDEVNSPAKIHIIKHNFSKNIKEHHRHKQIHSLDMIDRIKGKIKERKIMHPHLR